MAGKTLIGGTAYSIKGGKTLVGGTAYSIKGGKTLIGGTTKTITFKDMTLKGLLQNAKTGTDLGVGTTWAGRNANSTSTLGFGVSNGTWYVFTAYNGYFAITKVVKVSSSNITKTVIKQVSASYGNLFVDSSNVLRLSATGTSAVNVYGGTVIAFQFPDYTEAEADAILGATTVTRLNGRNSSSNAQVYTAASNFANKYAVVFFQSNICVSAMNANGEVSEVILYKGGYTMTNQSGLYLSSSNQYFSTNAAGAISAYGCSLCTII